MNLKISFFTALAICSLNADIMQNKMQSMCKHHNSCHDNNSTKSHNELKTIEVVGKSDVNNNYKSVITEEQIKNRATGNGNINDIIKALPNVQMSNSANSSLNPGEIEPKNISISGGLYYQNSFLIDGMNINNDISPAGAGANGDSWNTARWQGMPAGRSQGIAISTDLLESVEVLDMIIPASYGGFSGGVIEAKTKRPKKDFGFKISHKYTDGDASKNKFPHSFTKYQIDNSEGKKDDFLKASTSDWATSQPSFTKHFTTVTAEALINDQWGVIGQFDRKYSKIPLYSTSASSYNDYLTPANINPPLRKVNQKRYIYNAFLKAYYDPTPDLGFEFSYTYAPDYRRVYIMGTDDQTYTDLIHGGHLVGITTNYNNNLGKLKNVLNFSLLQDTVEAHGYDSVKLWMTSDSKNWASWSGNAREGGWLPGIQEQKTISNKLSQEFNSFEIGNSTHNIEAGLELSHSYIFYERNAQNYFNASSAYFMTKEQAELCKKGDMKWCDTTSVFYPNPTGRVNLNTYTDGDNAIEYEWTNPVTGVTSKMPYWLHGQYFRQATYYFPGKTSVTNNMLGVYLQDNIKIPLGDNKKYGELGITPSIRLDRDSYMRQTTVSPRFSTNYQFPWNEINPEFATGIIFGASRYYGRSIYETALADGVNGMYKTYRRNSPDVNWLDITDEVSNTNDSKYKNYENVYMDYAKLKTSRFDELKIPYSDEIAFALNQELGNWNLVAKYIKRWGNDELQRHSRVIADPLVPELEGYGTTYYYYTNEGKSKSDTISLLIKNKDKIEALGLQNDFSFAFDWTKVKRNYVDYGSLTNYEDFWISYQGSIIQYRNRPKDSANFARPYSVKINTNHEWNMLGAKWNLNNLFTYTASYKKFGYTGEYKPIADYGLVNGNGYRWLDFYDKVKYPSIFTWDLKLGAEHKIYGDNTLFWGIEFYNLLNQRKKYGSNNNQSTNYYNLGRQVWLEIGYKY